MTKFARKLLLVLAKLVVLSLVLAYAFSQMQWRDELVLRTPTTTQSTTLATTQSASGVTEYLIPVVDGTPFALTPKDRLRILASTPGAGVRVATHAGAEYELPRTLMEGPDARFDRLPGIRSTLAGVRWPPLVCAALLVAIPMVVIGFRWLLLLRAAGVRVPVGLAMKLHFLGLFFNTFMPGGTGGDIIKAVAITRHTHRRAAAVSMILVDRLIGMLVILIVPAATLLFYPEATPGAGRLIGLILLVLLVGSTLFLSTTFRRLVHWEQLLGILPGGRILQRVDEAVFMLRHKKALVLAAFVLGLFLQLGLIGGAYFCGQALGIEDARMQQYLVFIPTGLLANALPISFGGFGLMEGTYLKLFSTAGIATPSQGFMLGLLLRLLLIFWALPGGIIALTGFGSAARHAVEETAIDADAVAPPTAD